MVAQGAATGRVADLGDLLRDEAAFRAWYDATLPRVYGYLLLRTGRDHQIAEDLTQETFAEFVRSRHRYDGRTDLVAWIIGIARHRLADHYRRAERRQRSLLRLVAEPERPRSLFERVDDPILEAVGGLPPAQRAAVVLRYVDDLPVREVARLLHRSESATESLLSRARETLRRTGGMVR
jgi:RNA polymerase sigma-70 factor (ECF subfamily)